LTTGNAPGYLAFLGAVVAALIAWRSSSATRRSVAAARWQLARLEQQDVREQADRFAVWLAECDNLREKVGLDSKLPQHVYELTIGVSNTSGQPIFNARIYLRDDSLVKLGDIPVVPPAPTYSHWRIDVAADAQDPHGTYKRWVRGQLSVEIIFTDMHGQDWHRGDGGYLSAVTHVELAAIDTSARQACAERHDALRDEIFGTSIRLFELHPTYAD
jgi:hypothetical protein